MTKRKQESSAPEPKQTEQELLEGELEWFRVALEQLGEHELEAHLRTAISKVAAATEGRSSSSSSSDT